MDKDCVASMKHLSVIPYRDLLNWSVQYLTNTKIGFTDAYRMVRMGDFLRRNKTPITIEDDKEYIRVKIKTHNGGVERREKKNVLGKDIKTRKQYVISEGQFIISKIDARNGAMGIVPKELNGAIVTQDFLAYDIDTSRINPKYLVLVTTTKPFLEFCKSCSSGTTNRQRINEEEFLNIQIPAPKLEEQGVMMAMYEAAIKNAGFLKNKYLKELKLLDSYLLNTLGISMNCHNTLLESNEYQILKFVRLKNITRWDIYNSQANNQSSLFDNTTLSSVVIGKPQYGAAYKTKEEFDGIRYLRITDINDDGSLSTTKVSAEAFDEKYLLKKNDFLIARSGNTVGKTYLYENEEEKTIFAGYLIRFVLDTRKINPYYLLIYTKSSVYRQWIKNNMRITAQPNINCDQFLNSSLVLPPIQVQNEIVEYVKKKKTIIDKMKFEEKNLRDQAIINFQNKLFK